ncbi:thiol peroxidase [Haploplasma axanthum]|nr:thiol peroxidase [Haploplasma axanthum]
MRTYKGRPITLAAKELKVSDIAPNFKAVNKDLEDVSLSDFKNNYIVINVVPSLDTPVCDLQTKTLHEEVIKRDDLDIKVITISNDLPYAQERWCEAVELEGITVLSDYLYNEFGLKYGTLINELKLLARSVFVLNNKREIIYDEYAQEINQHLDYDKLLDFINKMPSK